MLAMTITIFYNFCRSLKLPTKAQIVFMVSFAVLNVIAAGAVGIRGLTWDKSAWTVTSWCILTNSAHWREKHIHVSLYVPKV